MGYTHIKRALLPASLVEYVFLREPDVYLNNKKWCSNHILDMSDKAHAGFIGMLYQLGIENGLKFDMVGEGQNAKKILKNPPWNKIDDSSVMVKITQNVDKRPKSMPNTGPQLMDATGKNVIQDVPNIANGSKMAAVVDIYLTANAQGPCLTIKPWKYQLIDLVEVAEAEVADDIDFGAVEGGYVAENNVSFNDQSQGDEPSNPFAI